MQLPAHTTHFLQAFDSHINKTFQRSVQKNVIAEKCFLDFGNMHLEMVLSCAEFRSFASSLVKKSFEDVGVWPFDFRFLYRFEMPALSEGEALKLPKGHSSEQILQNITNMPGGKTGSVRWIGRFKAAVQQEAKLRNNIESCISPK